MADNISFPVKTITILQYFPQLSVTFSFFHRLKFYSILWNNQQMQQCAVKFISLQVHSICFGRHTRPSSGVQF